MVINCGVMAFDLLLVYGFIMIMGFKGFARTISILFQLGKTVLELLRVLFVLLQQLVSEAVYGVKFIEVAAHHYDPSEEPPMYSETDPNSVLKVTTLNL